MFGACERFLLRENISKDEIKPLGLSIASVIYLGKVGRYLGKVGTPLEATKQVITAAAAAAVPSTMWHRSLSVICASVKTTARIASNSCQMG